MYLRQEGSRGIDVSIIYLIQQFTYMFFPKVKDYFIPLVILQNILCPLPLPPNLFLLHILNPVAVRAYFISFCLQY